MAIEDVPRTLVYKDIENIKDVLGCESQKTLESEFHERLIKCPFIENLDNPPKRIRTIFNNARYIYYLVYEEEDDPSLCFNFYLAKAVEGSEEIELKSHIIAATMALVYSWFNQKLLKNWEYIPELNKEIFNHFDKRKEENVKKLCEKIYLHFSKEEKEVTAEIIKVFHDLNLEKSDLPTNIDTLFEDILLPKEAAFNAPIQDIARGIGYLMECYDPQNGTNGERYLFLKKILNRFENEKSPEKDSEIIETAKERIKRKILQLEYAPEPEPSLPSLSFDCISIPKDDEPEIDPEIKDYIGWIIDGSKVSVILKTLHKYMKEKTKPRDLLMPICAAFEAMVIRKPTKKEYDVVFKGHPVKSEDSLNHWVSKEGQKLYKRNSYSSDKYKAILHLFEEIGNSTNGNHNP